jgi:hypothetical protein
MKSRPSVTAITDMAVLPGVLEYSFDFASGDHARDRQDRPPLRRTVQLQVGTNTLRSASGGLMKSPG